MTSKFTINGWIGVDLDGTLALSHSEKDLNFIGQPIAPMVERVKNALADGHDMRIFTARVAVPDEHYRRVIEVVIEGWCLLHLGKVIPITATKDFKMIELWDDRAVQVEKNTGEFVGYATRSSARARAYSAIDSERRYQDLKLPGNERRGNAIDRSLDEFILYIKQYADEAGALTTHEDEEAALNHIRKVAALCVGCMETHGAPKR